MNKSELIMLLTEHDSWTDTKYGYAFVRVGEMSFYRYPPDGECNCAEGGVCARPLPSWLVKSALILATILVAAAIGFDLLAPLLLDS